MKIIVIGLAVVGAGVIAYALYGFISWLRQDVP